uniref:Uncharacterized protein n=1 Tax=Micrurus corallinus TaxID=54390 RepID=A0A2D4EXW3_MICCO
MLYKHASSLTKDCPNHWLTEIMIKCRSHILLPDTYAYPSMKLLFVSSHPIPLHVFKDCYPKFQMNYDSEQFQKHKLILIYLVIGLTLYNIKSNIRVVNSVDFLVKISGWNTTHRILYNYLKWL